jgi:hypothetical protein
MAKNTGKLGRDNRIEWEQRIFVSINPSPFSPRRFPSFISGAKNFEIYIGRIEKNA